MLRVWAEEPGAAATVWRGKVQSLPDGEAYYFRGWEGLITHLQRMVAAEITEYLALDTRGGTVNTIRIVARNRIHPGKLEAFTEIAAKCLAAAHRDPGTQSYEWYFNADRSECVVLEVYDDSNAVLAHVGNLGDLLGQVMTVSDLTLEVFGDPSPALRQVGDSMGAKVYSYLQGLA